MHTCHIIGVPLSKELNTSRCGFVKQCLPSHHTQSESSPCHKCLLPHSSQINSPPSRPRNHYCGGIILYQIFKKVVLLWCVIEVTKGLVRQAGKERWEKWWLWGWNWAVWSGLVASSSKGPICPTIGRLFQLVVWIGSVMNWISLLLPQFFHRCAETHRHWKLRYMDSCQSLTPLPLSLATDSSFTRSFQKQPPLSSSPLSFSPVFLSLSLSLSPLKSLSLTLYWTI